MEMILPISRWVALVPAILNHHERWDGRGYPRGVAAGDIPLGGRILALSEAFEAMTRPTSRRPARTTDEALAEVEACAGTAFDPDLARAFLEEYRSNRSQLEGES
jgi:HD-GYP domain-containing protein (c-di-GMP phosphodiesterase class II)